ncbi:hypothetical protein XH99_09815 [Bradyrhizobium nanningense]|uniref:Conjugal transfer protein TraG n=1 Tax=Bradyrhizobium nanningense TaxID=1325118 RepID=A0A4Q0S7V0_9BRAD|nr:type IV secretory system conjugative DNA transfer family protein [Bradyrhizobium nanningense]RXH33067.1 hypothetical protein XH99_09815 [Bradyrhizobium nanningense]
MFRDARQNIFAIASPGAGKSVMLMRSLISYRGAVVLDVKGELYAATAGWRKRGVGPVYRQDGELDPVQPAGWVRPRDFAN